MKEKENYLQLIKNSKQENFILNEKTQKLEEEFKEDKESTGKINEYLQNDINEIYKKMDELKDEIEGNVKNNLNQMNTKIEDINKNISLIF